MNLSQESIEKIIVGVVTAIVILILSEPIKAGFKKVGNWFEGFFQSLGFGFQKRYYAALTFDKVNLPLIGRYKDIADPPKLEQVYISLKLNSENNAETIGWESLFRKPNKRIALIGLPGVGKTTLLNYLLLVFTGRIQKHAGLQKELDNPTPIYVRLRKVGKLRLSEFIASREYCGEEVPNRYFESRLEQGKCVVLFDGLDEVLGREDKKHIVREIGLFAEKYKKNWILITSRPQGWSKSYFADIDEYAIQKLEPEQVQKFIRDWYRVVLTVKTGASASREDAERAKTAAEETALKEAENLYGALSKKQNLFKEARYPLILVLITLVHRHHRRLPEGRADLYEECLDILLEDWDSEKEIVSPIPLSAKRPVLSEIAFKFLETGELEKSLQELEELVAAALPTVDANISPKEFIAQIVKRSDLLMDFGAGKYGFAHRALQDWLAAYHIKEEKLTRLLLDRADKDEWREVILIAVGLVAKDTRSELLRALLAKGDQSAASLAMAGFSLAEGIQVEPTSLRMEITDKLISRLNTASTASDFALLSDALFDANSTAMQDWIGSVLSGRDPTLQKRILASLIPDLGLEGAKPFLPTLTNVLADPHADAGLRAQCSLAIAKLKPPADTELMNALFSAAREQREETLKRAATWAYCELGGFERFGLLKIPAGEFLMGSSETESQAGKSEKPQHTIYLPDYYIAKYPVTVQEYQSFVNGSGYKTSNERSLKGEANHPVVNVTWKDALVFARWHGLTLPSEAEWEKAARGIDGRIYPWGNDWRNGVANTSEYWKVSQIIWDRLLRRKKGNFSTTPVGSFPKGNSPYGCSDMAGNVWEWTRSVLEEYPYDANDGREDENASGRRALRGGSFINNQRLARCAVRYELISGYFSRGIGFRVCASPNLS